MKTIREIALELVQPGDVPRTVIGDIDLIVFAESAMATYLEQQEPVAWKTPGMDLHHNNPQRYKDWTPLFTHSPDSYKEIEIWEKSATDEYEKRTAADFGEYLYSEKVTSSVKEAFEHGRSIGAELVIVKEKPKCDQCNDTGVIGERESCMYCEGE